MNGAIEAPRNPPEPRRLLGRYTVLGELASGGMAEILLATTEGPGGFVAPLALKRILPHFARDERFVTMFLDEARLLARVRHPNVVRVVELTREGSELILAMEYLEGESFASIGRKLQAEGTRLPYPLTAHLVAEACAGLHATHELTDEAGRPMQVVHRDVSPQNLMLTYDGHVKVLDFGIAKAADRMTHTEAGELKGKCEYMSPEQSRGEPLDRRSDIFSLGIVLYELSLQRRLYKRPNRLLAMRAICEEGVVPPSRVEAGYPRELERVVLRALTRDRNERYATAADMRRDLLRVRDALSSGGQGALPEEALADRMRRLFRERIDDKREVMRRAREGVPVGVIPPSETEIGIELPETVAPVAHTRATNRLRNAGILLGAAVVVAGSLGIARRELQVRRAQTPAAAPAAGLSAPEVASTVTIGIQSTPPGATVKVDGQDFGKTPTEITLPRSSDAHQLVLSHPTGGDASQTFTADVDQRLVLSLTPKPPATVAPPSHFQRAPSRPASNRSTTPATPAAPAAPPPSASPFTRFD